ncbi:T9SS type B sorting domain-containing protein [Aureispira anguillae]|uniref:Gliding motility-associated C-terminal domain-containing protein n=1 Tax=Aureispira anguillae TaxID=2864201 RepID=A0A916DUR6_9BACT|nr:gliding motility-associated C-terminal domain-containing protein [Aureispira anguillae]BDS12476.1 gliding motility-associated C-terminal domain-containing protein [Aureispira anguillae]
MRPICLNTLQRIIFCTAFVVFPLMSNASHIVGGEMNYRCLGNNRYEVRLQLFRDCDAGIPWFDHIASIGVYDGQTKAYLFQELVNWNSAINDTLVIEAPDSCIRISSNVCIHTTTYTDTIVLPLNSSGYILAYQRCCRNYSMTNTISLPGDEVGATYWTYISAAALQGCNNSAVFKDWLDVYLCSGVPVLFDHSAIDADGDSLVYELCMPSSGASLANSRPQPPSNPPYGNIRWRAPYHLGNIFGGADPFAIDPTTGLLTGTPNNLGVFLMGVCLKEYRNGDLISITRRDFQHIVGACNREVTARFNAVNTWCSKDLVYVFDNNSQTSTGIYHWTFDTLGTSTAVNPIYTFPDTGNYLVTLIAGIGEPCVDTFSMHVDAQIRAIEIAVQVPSIACLGDTILLVATDAYQDYSDSTIYTWTPTSAILSGQGTDSIWVVANQSTRFRVAGINNYGCSSEATFYIDVVDINALFDTLDLVCNHSLSIPFVNATSSNFVNVAYSWSFDTLGTSTAVHPIYTFPDTGRYEVTLMAGYGALCQDTFTREIYIPLDGASILSTAPTQACKGDTLILSVTNELADYNTIGGYTWGPNSPILSGQGTDSIQIVADVNTVFRVNAINENGCVDTVVLPLQVLQINAVFDSVELSCNKSLEIPFTNSSIDLTINFIWDFGGTGITTEVSPTYTFPDTGTYAVSLIGGIGTACPDTFRQTIDVRLDGVEIVVSDTQLVCRGDTVLLTALNTLSLYNSITNYSWNPITNIITGQGTDSINVLANTDLDFQVVGLNDAGCRDTALAHVNVSTISPVLAIVALPDSIFVGQTAQLYATNFLEYSYDWRPDTTLSAYDIYDPIAKPRRTKTYYLRGTNQYCTQNDSVTVYIKPPVCANPVVFVPSAFSPNGDGHNDVLMVSGNIINEMTMAIYNRWGQKVFETNDQNLGWDGTYLGKELPPDVYGYYMQCKCDDGGRLFLKGNITLLK